MLLSSKDMLVTLASFFARTLAYATYCFGYYSVRCVYSMLTADPSALSVVLLL